MGKSKRLFGDLLAKNIKREIQEIISGGDLEDLTKKKVLCELESRHSIKIHSDKKRKKFVYDETERIAEQFRKKRRKKAAGPNTSGLSKLHTVSDALAAFTGQAQVSRVGASTFINDYAKEHNLKDKDNKSIIKCDQALEELLGVKQCKYIELSGRLTAMNHFPASEKRSKRSTGRGIHDKQVVAPAFQAICGGQEHMSRNELCKAIFKYIKDNGLERLTEASSDGKEVQCWKCDDKMKSAFGANVETVSLGSLQTHISAGLTPLPQHLRSGDSSEVSSSSSSAAVIEDLNEESSKPTQDDDDNDGADDKAETMVTTTVPTQDDGDID